MSRRSWLLLALLSALWGASYLFIKVALNDGMSPPMIVFVRTLLAALVLVPLAARAGALAGLRGYARPVAVLAVVQMGGPLLLIATGEREISSSLTGILLAMAPIFTFLLAFALEGEEGASGLSLVGVAVGIGGVAMLLGMETGGGLAALAGGLMVVLASFGYSAGTWYLKRQAGGVEPLALAGATTAATALLMAPLAAIGAPSHLPDLEATGSLLALGVLSTGFGLVIFYALIASDGPARASLVGYIGPGFSVLYGVTLLDERFTVATAAGLVLILGGSWLAAEGRPPWVSRSASGELAAGGVQS